MLARVGNEVVSPVAGLAGGVDETVRVQRVVRERGEARGNGMRDRGRHRGHGFGMFREVRTHAFGVDLTGLRDRVGAPR